MAETQQTASRKRMVLVRVLVVLGAIFGAISLLAGYLRWQVFDEDTFKTTSEELIANQEIRDQVATRLVDGLFDNVDVAAALEERLPADQQGLAPVLTGAFRELSDRAAERLLERPRIQELWVESTVRAQRQLERVLDDDLTSVQTEGGYIVLNLQPLVVQLGDRVAIVGQISNRLPPDAGLIQIVEADNLETAQDITQLFKSVAPFVPVVPLGLFALAIGLARGRRRQAVRMVGLAFVLTGLSVLVLRRIAGGYLVEDLVASETVKPAAADAWNILTSLLADGAWTLIGLAVVVLIGVWLAGESRSGVAARRELAPFLARPEIAFGTLAVLFLLVVLWSPTAQTTRVPQMLALAVLLALGVEVLRRQAAREHPEAAGIDLGEHLRGRFARRP
jgi:hypothetical protein